MTDGPRINIDAITGVLLSPTGQWTDVEPGTFRIGSDPLFPGRPTYTFTALPPMIARERRGPVTVRCGPLDSVVQYRCGFPEE